MTDTNLSARPTIDFSGTSRATARSYANDLMSRANNEGTNVVLNDVSLGRKVDAYALNEALLDAMRHVATRFGQSMARRRAGEKAAHLGHIAQAVLANHADGLPAYAEGERSRKVQALEIEVADLRRDLAAAQHRAEEEEERGDAYAEHSEDVARALSDATAEVDQAAEKLREAQAVIEGLTEDLVQHVALREFTERYLLDAEGLAAVVGFTHGFKSAERD